MKPTQCTAPDFAFQALGCRQVVTQFSGYRVTSDAGGLLLREVEAATGIVRRLAACFVDYRTPAAIEHSVSELVAQRVFGLALGYEDLNDHDALRHDSLLALLVGKLDPTGQHRRRPRDRGRALAGKSTLNRLELAAVDSQGEDRYHRIVCRPEAVEAALVDVALDSYATAPERLVLDLDTTDDPLHGQQEGRFFHGYYGGYCYLPLYMFCGHQLLVAKLRPANVDAAAGAVAEVQRVVGQIRARWPEVRIILRADSGFAREELMGWCEDHGVDYVFGLARNARLEKMIASDLEHGRRRWLTRRLASRRIRNLRYRTLKTWSRARRVVAKAEYLALGANPRFVVTSIGADEMSARELYEDFYCARGDMENRIKEQQMGLFADRTSTSLFNSNQLRLWFSSFAYVLLDALRRLALAGTALATAQAWTIRLKLLKIGAVVSLSVRRILIQLPLGCPVKDVFLAACANLRRAGPLPA